MMELQSVVDPKIATSAMEIQVARERDQAAQTSTSSQEQAIAEEESGSAADEKSETSTLPPGSDSPFCSRASFWEISSLVMTAAV